MKILIINGPNLNLIGKREPSIYGSTDFETWFAALRRTYAARNVELTYRQSNIEGELIDCIQAADGRYDGVILNAGGYTHTSVAIADAIRAVGVPVVEVLRPGKLPAAVADRRRLPRSSHGIRARLLPAGDREFPAASLTGRSRFPAQPVPEISGNEPTGYQSNQRGQTRIWS